MVRDAIPRIIYNSLIVTMARSYHEHAAHAK